MTVGINLGRLDENDRIRLIGESVMLAPATSSDRPRVAGFIVESDEKAYRYVRKLQKRFPTIRIIDRGPGPVEGTVMVKIGPPLQ